MSIVQEPVGGQPPLGTVPSVPDLWEQLVYQRAFEAVVWSQPAVGIYGIRRALFEGLGMRDNDVLAMSLPLTTRHEFLTANNTTPYITANADLRHGPVVVEVPAATDRGALYGQVVDAWQNAVAGVGPSGTDGGKGGGTCSCRRALPVTPRRGSSPSLRRPTGWRLRSGRSPCRE